MQDAIINVIEGHVENLKITIFLFENSLNEINFDVILQKLYDSSYAITNFITEQREKGIDKMSYSEYQEKYVEQGKEIDNFSVIPEHCILDDHEIK